MQTAAGMLATLKQDTEGARRRTAARSTPTLASYHALAGPADRRDAEQAIRQGPKALIEQQLAKMPNDPNVLLMAAQTYDAWAMRSKWNGR